MITVIQNAQALSTTDNLKGYLVVFWVFSPTSRLRSPKGAFALYPAPIRDSVIIDRSDVAQKQNVAIDMGHAEMFWIAILDCSDHRSADQLGLQW